MFTPEQVADLLTAADGDYDDELDAFVSVRRDGSRLILKLCRDGMDDGESFTVTVEKDS